MTKDRILEKLEVAHSAIGKDLLLFFLPFFTVFFAGLLLCETQGDGFSDIWAVLWGLIKQPGHLFRLPAQRAVGLALFVLGLTTMIVAQVTLWRNYSGFLLIRKDHQLITHGLYRLCRHPIYLGALMVFAGLPVYAASLYGFLAMLLLIPIILNRIRLEEKLLTKAFGDAYQKYKETTKKLIPFIY